MPWTFPPRSSKLQTNLQTNLLDKVCLDSCLTNLFKNADARAAKICQNADKSCLPKLQTKFVYSRQGLSILELALRAPLACLPAIPVAGSGLAPFCHFFFWPAGGYLRPRAKTRVFHAQGGCWGVWGRKGAVQGPPIDPSNGPLAGLVERDTFFSDPPFGLWGLFKTPIGQNLGR